MESSEACLFLRPIPGTLDTLGKVGREKSSREVGKAQSPHGTVLFVAVSFRFRCEVKRELRQGNDISIVSIKERPPERKDKCPSDQDIAKGAEVAGRGNAFQNLRRETITVVIVIGVLWEYFISRKSYILHL